MAAEQGGEKKGALDSLKDTGGDLGKKAWQIAGMFPGGQGWCFVAGCGCFALFIVILIVMIAMSLMATGMGEETAMSTEEGAVAGGGCYLVDSAFRDTSRYRTADQVLMKLGKKYPKLNGKKTQIQTLIDKSVAQRVNPALLMGIWAGEQSFGADYKAMGCGIYSGSTNRYTGFNNQVDCSLRAINKAITKTPPYYHKPEGQNIFTRLFYNYTESMKHTYETRGYVAHSSNARIIILNHLVPDQVMCSDGTNVAGNVIVGKGKCAIPVSPYKGIGGYKYGSKTSYNNFHTGCDFTASTGTKVLASMDGIVTVSKLSRCRIDQKYPSCSADSPGRGFGNYIIIKHENGKYYTHYHHLMPNKGKKVGDVVRKGDVIGYVDNNGVSSNSHLHWQLNAGSSAYGAYIYPCDCLGIPHKGCAVSTKRRY